MVLLETQGKLTREHYGHCPHHVHDRRGGNWFIVREKILILHRVFSFQEIGERKYPQLVTAGRSLTAIM
jgi:hypothetical protein